MRTTNEDERVENIEEREHPEGPVAPLVSRLSEGSHKTGHNHNLICQDSDEDSGGGNSGGQEQVEEQKWRGDKPVNVADVEDLASASSTDHGVAGAWKFNLDGDLTKASSHTEVGYRGDHSNAGGDVVEKPVRTRLTKAHAHEGKSSDSHDGTNSEVPVRAIGRNVEVRQTA